MSGYLLCILWRRLQWRRGGNLVVTVNCIVGLANLMTHGSRVSQRRFGRFLAQTVLCGSGQTWLIAGLLALEKTLRHLAFCF